MAGESNRFAKKIQDFFYSFDRKVLVVFSKAETTPSATAGMAGPEVPGSCKRFCLNCWASGNTIRNLDGLAFKITRIYLLVCVDIVPRGLAGFSIYPFVIKIDTFRADST